jgi:predicted RNA-binding Zn ribbon-like protein
MADPAKALYPVIEFVNTVDVDAGVERLDTPASLAVWLGERGLLEESARSGVTKRDLKHAIDLREALRAQMFAHNGGTANPEAAATLDEAAVRGRLGVRFGGQDSVAILPEAPGVAGALAALLAPVAAAIADGSWQRAKACREQGCQWAFYDRSRNRSGVWCEMAVCGNRTKVRAYRRRASG